MQHSWRQLRKKKRQKKKDLQTDTCAHRKSELGGLDSQLAKTQTLGSSACWTKRRSPAYSWTKRRNYCTQINKEAEFTVYSQLKNSTLAILGRKSLWWSSLQAVHAQEGKLWWIFCTHCQHSHLILWGRLCHLSKPEDMETLICSRLCIQYIHSGLH